mmetsp:Transcript_88338/g.184605  ORF Transcript_88338/g.184605 Transcript_88338/m.184605 type:complete len:201 (+) Transcript_88338:2294-2896(+)
MPAAIISTHAFSNFIAVAQQHRTFVTRRLHTNRGILGHHIGTIREVGEPSETLGLHLSAVHTTAVVESTQLGVLLRGDLYLRPQLESGAVLEAGDCHALLGELIPIRTFSQGFELAVGVDEADGLQCQVLPIEYQRISFRGDGSVQLATEGGLNLGPSFEDLDIQLNLANPIVRLPIVLPKLLQWSRFGCLTRSCCSSSA